MRRSVFLSYPTPFNDRQREFADAVRENLRARDFDPRTLGVTDFHSDLPLKEIRRLMLESNGLITIAFRRAYVSEGQAKPETQHSYSIGECWLTSPFSHIEPAMAYQIGLPVVILREQGVIADGVLEPGIFGSDMPEFDLEVPTEGYLESPEWNRIILNWEDQVNSVLDSKGERPKVP